VWEIHYPIEDQHAPKNVDRFQKMITYLCNQLQAGKTVHVGCIGGHGRTGVVIAAIVAEMKDYVMGQDNHDVIQWVRKHYCEKAVESWEQVKFLQKYYGVSKAEPSKVPRYMVDVRPGEWMAEEKFDDDLAAKRQ
jgi:protein-tyrosine phosphatase